ncbi:hypothetical protein RclHR1_18000009 [Rhizophagus clarus]|uniref:Uncharacterized protein n=1 Tax=Rhizophagus clarus TaxID=94130 RepID=A0A2Z6QL85_9GLOM|nr:hypothetical protein RclHR1_18000009 [Rhizophagus clarus]GES79023.1 hypothetical protein RCL_jg6050.t1 [Rhizophagus clarus]
MDLYSKELVNLPIEYIEMRNKLKEYFAQKALTNSRNSHSSTIEIQNSAVTAPLVSKSFDTLLLCLVIIIGFYIWYFYSDVLFIVYRIYIVGDVKLKVN